jgi:hypothetical protein
MPFEVGDDIVNNNDETYLVEKVEVIRLPPDSPGEQGDIARYHYHVKRYTTGQKYTIQIVVELNPDNNIDIRGVSWNKVIARGVKQKKTRRRRTNKRKRQTNKRISRRQTKGKKKNILK